MYILSILLIGFSTQAAYDFLPVHRPYSPSIEKQQQQHLLRPPYVSPGEPDWENTLFTKKLIADFYRKYEEEIGSLESGRLIRSFPNLYNYPMIDSLTFRRELIEQNNSMLKVGEYISLKTTEFHLDQYLRSHPRTQKAYEIKVKYTSANLDMGKKGKFKTNYSISGNYLELQYLYDENIISYKVEYKKINEGFFQQAEGILLVDYFLPARLALRILYFALEKGYSVIFRRAQFDNLTISLTYNGDRQIPDSIQKENSILLGAVFFLPPTF